MTRSKGKHGTHQRRWAGRANNEDTDKIEIQEATLGDVAIKPCPKSQGSRQANDRAAQQESISSLLKEVAKIEKTPDERSKSGGENSVRSRSGGHGCRYAHLDVQSRTSGAISLK